MASPEASTKCPCCDNPWSRATGDFFAKMCVECEEKQGDDKKDDSPQFGLNRDNMDTSVSPQDNFFHYANGGWMKANPIPAGYPSWNTFLTLHVQSQERCKQLLEELEKKNEQQLSEDERKLAAFYLAAMDEDAVEKAGTTPLEPVLKLIDQIVENAPSGSNGKSSIDEFAKLLGKMPHRFGIYPFFSTGPSPDAKNSDHTLCNLSQGGLGMPDRDYYFDEDKQEKRDAYKQHVAKMLTLLEQGASSSDESKLEPTEAALEAAQQVYDLEVRLAEAHMTRTENRDPEATYNKMSIAQLNTKAAGDAAASPTFDFGAYLLGSTGKTVDELGDVNVRNVDALQRVANVVTTVEPAVLKHYLQWRTVSSCAPYMSKAFVNENFDFFERCLSGTTELKPRWKRAMAFVESALGEALGQIYCQTYFDQECKERAVAIVEAVRQALEERLNEVEWMTSESTREQALKKMSRFRVKIGYPNKWIDYTTLDIQRGQDFLSLVFKERAFAHARETKEMNAPTDREKWFMTPQTVNAYYHPSLNEIVFPAAILQHPFFDKNADAPVNFGAMGAVVGHEMTHAFDDKGRKFNFNGILHDWWTPADAEEYERRVQVQVDQADAFKVHGKSVQGKLTSGENIADLGGLRLSLRALKAHESFQGDKIDGFTPTQRFFLAWAQCWRQNITEERSLQLLTLDPHGPNEMRCNGPLANMDEFHKAFDIPEESAMFKPEEARVDIW